MASTQCSYYRNELYGSPVASLVQVMDWCIQADFPKTRYFGDHMRTISQQVRKVLFCMLNCHFSHEQWYLTIQWRHNGHDGVSNHQRLDCLLNLLFRRRSKKTSELRVTCLCEGNSPVTGEFPAQRASNAENISVWWRHQGTSCYFAYWISILPLLPRTIIPKSEIRMALSLVTVWCKAGTLWSNMGMSSIPSYYVRHVERTAYQFLCPRGMIDRDFSDILHYTWQK